MEKTMAEILSDLEGMLTKLSPATKILNGTEDIDHSEYSREENEPQLVEPLISARDGLIVIQNEASKQPSTLKDKLHAIIEKGLENFENKKKTCLVEQKAILAQIDAQNVQAQSVRVTEVAVKIREFAFQEDNLVKSVQEIFYQLEDNQELRSKDALIEKLLIEKRELQRVFTEELAKAREPAQQNSNKSLKTSQRSTGNRRSSCARQSLKKDKKRESVAQLPKNLVTPKQKSQNLQLTGSFEFQQENEQTIEEKQIMTFGQDDFPQQNLVSDEKEFEGIKSGEKIIDQTSELEENQHVELQPETRLLQNDEQASHQQNEADQFNQFLMEGLEEKVQELMGQKVQEAFQKQKPLKFPVGPNDYTDPPVRQIRTWHQHQSGLAWMQCEYDPQGKRDGCMVQLRTDVDGLFLVHMKNEVQHGGQYFINSRGQVTLGRMVNGKKDGVFTKISLDDSTSQETFKDGELIAQ